MDTQTKRTLLATALCLAVLFGWMKLMPVLYPPPPPSATSAPAAAADSRGGRPPTDTQPVTSASAEQTPTPGLEPTTAAAPTSRSASEMWAAGTLAPDAPSAETVAIGDERENNAQTGFVNPFEMGVVVTPRGAAVESVKLSRHRNHPPKDRKNPTDDPYPLLKRVTDPDSGKVFDSFVTESVRLVEDKVTVPLDNVVWSLRKEEAEAGGEKAVLQTRVKSGAGEAAIDLLEITKTYLLERGSPLLVVALEARNLSDKPHSVILIERGPMGIQAEDLRTEYRYLVFAVVDEKSGKITSGANLQRASVIKAEDAKYELLPGEDRDRLWAAIGNKYFACIVDPKPLQKDAKFADYVGQVFGRAPLSKQTKADDLTFEWLLKPAAPLAPQGQAGDSVTLVFSTYCGAQGERALAALPVGQRDRGYEIVSHVNVPSCTFSFLTTGMQWLLTRSYRLAHNYGIAIFILVIVVRLVLHPISKRSQMNMMKMQKGMAHLKPKIEAIQQQYKNDKQRLNEETMKLYREERINPASQFLGCLPMFLQMPILVALYTALNLDVELRHQSFCLWIHDLSSPDALIRFGGSYSIPFIGSMIGPITALNILPLIMTVTMYAQQKFMQKLTAAQTPPTVKRDKDGNPIPDQMAQQQKMMNFMMIFFGLMFYNLPSGLNLYFLSSNLLGMLEQYIIKKEMRRKEARGDFEVKQKPAAGTGKPSLFGRYIDLMQKKAEQVRLVQSERPQSPEDKKRSKTRP